MLSIKAIGASAKSHEYYAEYAQGQGEPEGVYYGEGACELGIDETTVSSQQMKQLLRGYSPDGKRALCQNAGETHRGGWDLCFSAPKSVSIAWANGDEKLRAAIEKAQSQAVKAGLDYLQDTSAEVRLGKTGNERAKAKVVAACFEHGISRAGDPQLHTHAIVFNVAKSQNDGRWRSPESRNFFVAQMAASAFYKAELANQVQNIGFRVSRTKDSFEIMGVPQEVCESQSTRSQQIKDSLARSGLDENTSNARAKEVAALKTRAEKFGLKRDFERWQQENTRNGFGPQEQLNLLLSQKQGHSKGQTDIRAALKKVTEQQSTFTEHELCRAVAENSIGFLNASEARRAVRGLVSSKEVIKLGDDGNRLARYSTPEMIKIEGELMSLLENRRDENRHVIGQQTIDRVLSEFPTLNAEQRKAAQYLARGAHGVAFIEGQAGTGKSFMLRAANKMFEAGGHQVVGLSFTNKAATNLEESSGIKSQSVDAFLHKLRKEQIKLTQKSVLVVDEAAMLDSRKTLALSQAASDAKAKLIFAGDAKQIQPITAGQAFEAQKNKSVFEQLTVVFRQSQDWERNAVQSLREGKTLVALKAFDEKGQIKINETRSAAREALASDWFQARQEHPNRNQVMIATTNAEVGALNGIARERLKGTGKLGDGIHFKTAHGNAEFSVGDKIVFTGNLKRNGIYNSVLGEIVSLKTGEIVVKTENNRTVRFDPTTFDKFRHGYAITAHKSQGSTFDRAFVLVDGFNMDKEKFYVAMSRGREGNTIYVDKSNLREMSYEVRKALKQKPESERSEFEKKHFLKELANIVGVSHQKDTTQDYLGGDVPKNKRNHKQKQFLNFSRLQEFGKAMKQRLDGLLKKLTHSETQGQRLEQGEKLTTGGQTQAQGKQNQKRHQMVKQ